MKNIINNEKGHGFPGKNLKYLMAAVLGFIYAVLFGLVNLVTYISNKKLKVRYKLLITLGIIIVVVAVFILKDMVIA